MDVKKIAIFGGLAAVGIYLSNKIKKLSNDIDNNASNLSQYIEEQQIIQTTPPANQYLKITPYADFSDVTGKLWIGAFHWEIKNTSKNYTFIITKIKGNFYMDGYAGAWVPGHRNMAYRLAPGKSIDIYSTWQDGTWIGLEQGRDAVRDKLRANMDTWLKMLTSDTVVTIAQPGQAYENDYSFRNLQGYARLRSGAIFYWKNEGENAADW